MNIHKLLFMPKFQIKITSITGSMQSIVQTYKTFLTAVFANRHFNFFNKIV